MKITVQLPIGYTMDALAEEAQKHLQTEKFYILKRSLDARRKNNIHYQVTISDEPHPVISPPQMLQTDMRPVIIGGGPCGLFSALWLSLAGLRPILIERGAHVLERQRYAQELMVHRALNPESNIAFGIGGAGAFSDGKLNTGTNSPYHHYILETMVSCGAPADILYEAKPHIGSDNLPKMLTGLCDKIEALGGEIRCNTKMEKLMVQHGEIIGVEVSSNHQTEEIFTRQVILAIGHSARDTFSYLFHGAKVPMEQKNFAVGFRIEHLQEDINLAQYGNMKGLPSADYKLVVHTEADVYSFCMCPGGTVVPAMHESRTVCTNGMSVYQRNGKNSNAAIVTPVSAYDFESKEPLAGMEFQRKIEETAYQMGGHNYNAPLASVGSFLGKEKTSCIEPTYRPGVTEAPLHLLYPYRITKALQSGILAMDQKLKGFAKSSAVLTGPETRTSSPVRILRDENGRSTVKGLFPAGEGSGWAGGILSAAADGIRQAEHVITYIKEMSL